MVQKYQAIISSDWNGCLAPCGPFDYIAYTYPKLASELDIHFRHYIGGEITLREAVDRVNCLLPRPVSKAQMDDYLAHTFMTYKGVERLVDWCLSRNICFMVNTTGVIGYFQRVFSLNKLPVLPVVSAYPRPVYSGPEGDGFQHYELNRIEDKGRNTERAALSMGIPFENVIVMGDSGGDGPHFKWARQRGAFLIASMAKPSLKQFCEKENIRPGVDFGLSHNAGETVDREAEMTHDFMDLCGVIETALKLT